MTYISIYSIRCLNEVSILRAYKAKSASVFTPKRLRAMKLSEPPARCLKSERLALIVALLGKD